MHPDEDRVAGDGTGDGVRGRVATLARAPIAERARAVGTLALDAVPVVVAVLLLGGVVTSAIALLGVAHPDLGWSDLVVLDAKAWNTGHLPYGDPATGYVGLLYTPLFTGTVALLLGVRWWEGWGPLVSLVSVAGSLVVIGRLALHGAADRRAAIAPVAAVVAFPLAAFTIFPTNGVFEARPDQLAWCLLLVAAARVVIDSTGVVTHVVARSWRGRAVTGLLLAASVLAKQTTLIPALVVAGAAAGVALGAGRGRPDTEPRGTRLPVEGLVAAVVGAATIAVLQVASDGFAVDLMFGVARRHGRWRTVGQVVESDLELLAVPIAIVTVALLLAVLPALVRASPRDRVSRYVPLAVALAIGAATVPGAVLAQAKQGGDTNQLAGPVWGAALVLATALMLADARARRSVARVVGVLLVVSSVGLVTDRLEARSLGTPDLVLDHDWREVPSDLVTANEVDRLVLDYEYPSYSITRENSDTPGEHIAPDLTAAGYTPRAFVRALLDGRYDRVRLFPEVFDGYAAGYGQRDESFFWKINELVLAGYERAGAVRAHGTDPGVTFYAPGPRLSDLAWMERCFGPYRAGDLDLAVRAGGGRWCVDRGRLRLDAGPRDTSELVLGARARTGFDLVFATAPGSATLTASDGESALVSTDGGTTAVRCPDGERSGTDRRIEVVLDPDRTGIACAERAGAVVVHVGAADDATLVAAVAGRPQLDRFRSGGDRVRVRLHDPEPGDFD